MSLARIAYADWLDPLIEALQGAQSALLQVLGWLHLTPLHDGQPSWPWASRLSGENLLIDLGQARRLGWTVLALAAAAGALLLAIAWRRRRILLLALAVVLVAVAPWPEAEVVLVPAYPSSFDRSPTGFSADSIERGAGLYAQHCASCHGADGRGQGPQAASLAMWPPNLDGPLLWRRADGDLLWHILHGTKDFHGATTMAGYADRLSSADAWSLIDFMKAQGAGQTLVDEGYWARPIALPDMRVRCDGRPPQTLGAWHGQRIRLVAAGDKPPLEDPRLKTVAVEPVSGQPAPPGIDCVADGPAAWKALELVTGSTSLAGVQVLADRDGFLRARSMPGQGAWSDDDLLCRAERPDAKAQAAMPAARRSLAVDGLGALIARMDAEPVRDVKGGLVH